jgi:DNA polymerase-3 subunit delta
MPFLSERRLVVIDGLPKRRREQANEAGDAGEPLTASQNPPKPPPKGRKAPRGPDPKAFVAGLANHAERLPETTVLVVMVEELLEQSHPLVDTAERNGRLRAFVPPKGPQLEAWAVRRAQAHGTRMDTAAARLLATLIGSDLRALAGEVEKLATYAGPEGQIGVAEVRLLTQALEQARVFDLTDALARRDHARALALLHELLDAGESPLGIVALTASQTRLLLQVKALADEGMRAAQIAQTAGLAPFMVEKAFPLVRQFSFAQLDAAHHALLEVDTGLKLSKMTPEMALDLLVVGFGR